MKIKRNAVEVFFESMNKLISFGAIERRKDYEVLVEQREKLLFVNLEAVYPHYKSFLGDEALSLKDLRFHLETSLSFELYIPFHFKKLSAVNDSDPLSPCKKVESMMFSYDVIVNRYPINFERYSIEEFESAILAMGLKLDIIEEIKVKGRFVRKAFGTINERKFFWDAKGRCFHENGFPNSRYNLKIE